MSGSVAFTTYPLIESPPLRTGRSYAETIAELNAVSFRLSTRPETVPAYQLRLYPLSLERSALLAAAALQERYALESIQTAYEEERAKVEEEWKRGRERIRERLLDGIEERRRRAREEKDGEGAAGGAYLRDVVALRIF